MEAVQIQFPEVVLRNHGKTNALRLGLWLRGRLRWHLELARIEIQKVGLCVLLGGRLRLLALLLRSGLRCDGLLVLLSRCWLLQVRKHGWVVADVLNERCESWVAKKSLNEPAVALVLLHEGLVLAAEGVALLSLQSNLAFELANVFCEGG